MSMQNTTLSAKLRTLSGKGPARQLRFSGLIPAVCYGKGNAPTHIAVDPTKIKDAIATPHKFNTVIKLEIEGGGTRTVLFKDFEKDPLNGNLLHADFLDVDMAKDVTVKVPVVLVGKPAGAAEGGILQQVARTIAVQCLPANIPVNIQVDISHLQIAESMHVSDIKAPAGVKFRVDGGATIAVVAIPEKEEVKAVVAAVPGAEGAVAGAVAAVGADGKPAPAGKPAPDGKAAPAAAGAKAPAKK